MRKVMEHLGTFRVTNLTVWLNGDYGEPTQAIIAESQAKVEKLLHWAEALNDEAVRDAYLFWIGYWQHGLDGAREELRTRHKHRDHETRDRDFRARDHAALEYAKRHIIPEPPK